MDVTLNNTTIAKTVFACVKQESWCQGPFQSGIHTSAIVVIIFNVLLALIAVLSNGLVFVAYYQNESIRKPANTILLSLAVTDFLTGAVSQPLFVYEKVIMLSNCTEQICTLHRLRSIAMSFLLAATLFNLSLSTLDRYVAVVHSFRYIELVTNSRVIKVVLALWSALIGITPVCVLILRISLSVAFSITSNVIFISIMYYKIFKEIRRLQADPVVAANEAEETRKAKEHKSAANVAIILGLLFFCYIPMILYLMFFITQYFILRTTQTANFDLLDQKLFFIVITIASSNSSLNVFVHFWKNGDIRSAMLKVVRPLTQRFANEVNPA